MFDGQIPAFNMPMGPGSQDESEDGEVLNYMPMPKEMAAYDMPILPEDDLVESVPELKQLLHTLLDQLGRYSNSHENQQLDLQKWPKPAVELLSQILGEGEVSILVDSASISQGATSGEIAGDTPSQQRWQIQETVLAGVWRIQCQNEAGELTSDLLEVADIPQLVRQQAFEQARIPDQAEWFASEKPQGVMNAPMVLVELRDQADQLKDSIEQQKVPHVVNLSLLPISPLDLDYINERLGIGPITILSRGYGNCRITATALPNTWWVQYYNSGDQLILNTLEICAVPEVALAANEDFEDSIERLQEIIQAYEQDQA